MRQSGKCPKCGSQNIIANARAKAGYEMPIDLVVYEDPEAILLKGRKERYTLGAWICQGCGYTELYCL